MLDLHENHGFGQIVPVMCSFIQLSWSVTLEKSSLIKCELPCSKEEEFDFFLINNVRGMYMIQSARNFDISFDNFIKSRKSISKYSSLLYCFGFTGVKKIDYRLQTNNPLNLTLFDTGGAFSAPPMGKRP